MLSDVMMPEASERGGQVVGLLATLRFLHDLYNSRTDGCETRV
jgi:hypothetical protein